MASIIHPTSYNLSLRKIGSLWKCCNVIMVLNYTILMKSFSSFHWWNRIWCSYYFWKILSNSFLFKWLTSEMFVMTYSRNPIILPWISVPPGSEWKILFHSLFPHCTISFMLTTDADHFRGFNGFYRNRWNTSKTCFWGFH